jgi:hypothetical protein
MAQPITEIMDALNADPKNLSKFAGQAAALKLIFEYAYLPEKKFLLPAGAPPYKPTVEPLGMTPTNLYTELRRFYVFTRADLKQLQREIMFVGLLEGIHPKEADMMIAIKDQKFNKIYPKLTKKWAEDAGFIPKVEKAPKKAA